MTPFNDRGPFVVGDLCVIVGAQATQFNGLHVTVTAVLGEAVYQLDLQCPHLGCSWMIHERHLRRRRPPTTGEALIRAMFTLAPEPAHA